MRTDIPNDIEKIKNNPIVILDIDGVLWAPEYMRMPRKYAIDALNRIIEETKAKIVISSSWKIYHFKHDMTLAEIYLNTWGVHDPEVIGFTYGVKCEIPNVNKNGRELEIDEWINIFKPLNWCAIDDSIKDGYRLVQTEHVIGLTNSDADKVIKYLREK